MLNPSNFIAIKWS